VDVSPYRSVHVPVASPERVRHEEPTMTTTTNTPMAKPAGLALGLGRSRTLVAVTDLAEASRVYRRLCEENLARTGKGASGMKEGLVYDTTGATPRVVARVSWNGCVWSPEPWTPSDEPLFDPSATGGAR
jgi:hypothetical protein